MLPPGVRRPGCRRATRSEVPTRASPGRVRLGRRRRPAFPRARGSQRPPRRLHRHRQRRFAWERPYGSSDVGSGARPVGHADRVGAVERLAGPSGPMPAGAFPCEAVDAHLARTVLGSAGQPGPMPLRLSTTQLAGIVVGVAGSPHRRGRHIGRSGGSTDREFTAAPTARLALGVMLGLRISLALGLLQTTALTERCAHLAALHLADPPARMSERLLLLRRGRRFVGGRLRRAAGLAMLWCSRYGVLRHRATEYCREPAQTHAMPGAG